MRGRLLSSHHASRRRLLEALAGLGAALAGCASVPRGPTPSTDTPAPAGPSSAIPAPPDLPSPEESFPPRPLCFEVSGQSSPPWHLFGTLHVGAAADYPLPAQIEAAIDAAGALAIEIDTPGRWGELVEAFRPHVWLDDADTLDTLIEPTLLARFRSYFAIEEQDWQRLRRMQPWWVAQFRFASAADRRLGLQRQHGSEQYFVERARVRGCPIVELETVAEQVDSVCGATLAEQAQQFASLFELVVQQHGFMTPLRAAWRRGDPAALAGLKRHSWGDDSHLVALWRRSFAARDQRIADRLRARARATPALFAAIGVFHLVGPDSVPQRLREAGLRVRPLDDRMLTLQSPLLRSAR